MQPLSVALRKQAGGRAPGAAAAGGGVASLRRIVGYVEEAGSGEEGGNPFDMGSGDEAEDDGVVDRWVAFKGQSKYGAAAGVAAMLALLAGRACAAAGLLTTS